VEPPVPAAALPTLGSRLLLVANRDVDFQAARRLTETIYASQFAKMNQPPLDTKLLEMPSEYPWHDGTRLYRARNQPLLSGPMVDLMHKGFAILAAAASGLFVLWQWSKQRGAFARDQGFNKYINQLTRIEDQVARAEHGPGLDHEQLLALREELHKLKAEALNRFTEGEMAGKELLAGFLVHVHDARDYVTRLMQQQTDAFK
jgi:hypothetical protein